MRTSRSAKLGSSASSESVLASSLALTMSISLMEPRSRALALNNSWVPVRTVRSASCRSTMASPSSISRSSVVAQ